MLFGRKMEEEKKVKLGIGIGVESYVVGTGGGLFTAGQFLELQQQALIYKYLAAGIAVPFHLLAPIWDSLAASFTSAGSIYKQFPSCMPFNRLDRSDRMDPEPGRCRRTDGKKWRCGRNVVPDHKYCEQHVHRGRLRSRKPVENSEVAPPTSSKNPKNSETSIQISPPKSLQLTPQSSLNTSLGQGTSTASGGHHERDKNIRSVTTTSICYIPPASETATSRAAVHTDNVARPTTGNKVSSTQINLNIGVGDNSSNHGAENCMIRGSSNTRNNLNISYSTSPGLGFSPKSVLQGSNGIHLGNQSGEELEPVRCRRTDGIKWPCRREGLRDEKYGSQHIGRGAKRQTNGTRLSQTISKTRKTDYAVPSTNLSISISASSSLIQNDEKCDSVTDSDTTITDTSLAAYDSGCESS